jgi:hypothetical protein
MSDHLGAEDLNRVRIPSELHGELSRFFSDLQQRTLRLAVQQADARTEQDELFIMQPQDVASIARSALSDAALKLEAAFASQESEHVRRAS